MDTLTFTQLPNTNPVSIIKFYQFSFFGTLQLVPLKFKIFHEFSKPFRYFYAYLFPLNHLIVSYLHRYVGFTRFIAYRVRANFDFVYKGYTRYYL